MPRVNIACVDHRRGFSRDSGGKGGLPAAIFQDDDYELEAVFFDRYIVLLE